MNNGSWRCKCGKPMEMGHVLCPNCKSPHVYDPKERWLRLATPNDYPFFCINREGRKLGCNWLAPRENSICYSCSLTETTPVLGTKENRNAYKRFEKDKRRLIAALLRIGLLPVYETAQNGAKLRFHLKQDRRDNPEMVEDYVMTGHAFGNVTLNIRETDRVRIEATKRAFNEKYRTTLGTLRHEVGHFFFLALVWPSEKKLGRFRELFGDETIDYEQALSDYYTYKKKLRSPSAGFISSYAMSHPHEDWAETWAHYMHIEDALAVNRHIQDSSTYKQPDKDWFDFALDEWNNITNVMNALSLSMGHAPAYPFRLTEMVADKIRFIANTIIECGGAPFYGLAPVGLAQAAGRPE